MNRLYYPGTRYLSRRGAGVLACLQPVLEGEKEIEAKLDAYLEAYKASNQVLVDWYPKFKKVLPIRKVAKLYQAEEAFQMRMINNLRRHPAPSYPKKDS